MLYTLALALFLIIVGLSYAGVAMPQVLRVIGGLAGALAGLILLFGLF